MHLRIEFDSDVGPTCLKNKNIRMLEQIDESFLSKILECEANTKNTKKYLELGIYPIRFKIMKHKIIFVQYILKQEKSSMMYQVLKAVLPHRRSVRN